MSLETARKFLEEKGYGDRIHEFAESTATVEEAAAAVGCEPAMIAKTLSFLQDGAAVLILADGDARIDNRKYKDTFHTKAKMIPYEEVESYIGHAPGGVCPFGILPGVRVYLDESLHRHEIIYPAAGNAHTAVRLTPEELDAITEADGWVDVCK